MLARESRPLSEPVTQFEIKTHPEATHINCTLSTEDYAGEKTRFSVDCDGVIEPVGRHFIIIGAMKAGTTTLFRTLEKHPELCRTWAEGLEPSTVKEINYFCKLYRPGHTALHYDWRFPFNTAKHAWTLDASPNYAKLPRSRNVPERIAALEASVKIAYILRNPIDRVESHVAHALKEGAKVKNLHYATRLSRYAAHMDNYVRHIPVDDILLLDFAQLKQDPASIYKKISAFLGIEEIVPERRVHNRRRVDFRLTSAQRRQVAETVRPDVERLIDVYGFEPAATWLEEPRPKWRRWFQPGA